MTIRRGNSIIAGNSANIPSQTGQSGKFLTTNGTMASWGDTVDYTNITNCVTEIPQDIKLELKDGALTLKAGSKVYVPNGFESDGTTKKFDEVIVSTDKILTGSWGTPNEKMFLYYRNNSLMRMSVRRSVSGESDTYTEAAVHFWYDTTNNIMIEINAEGEVVQENYSLPLCIFTAKGDNTASVTSIDQVFNGFGYIGSTVFALPGVKGLIPNGRNADGSLKNLLSINNSVQIYTLLSSETKENIPIYVKRNGLIFRALNHIYDEKNNFNLNFGDINYCYVGPYVSYTNGKITSLTLKTVFHAVDYNDFSDLKNTVTNNKVAKSGDTMTGQLVVKDANIILSSTKDVMYTISKVNEDNTQTPTKNYIDGFRVVDKNNKIMSDFRSQRNSASNLTQMIARKNNADGTIRQADITCSVDAKGNPLSILNQTTHVNGTVVSNLNNVNFIARSKSLVKGTTPTDSNKYIGYDWQDKNGQRLAYLGVVYGISGSKRLELQKLDSNLSEFNISYPIRNPYSFYLQDTAHTLGNVNENTWSGNQIQFQDSKGTRLARIQPMLATDGTSRLCLAASKGTESESSLVIGSDGYTQCPKPADNSNTNAIATTNWAGGLKRANTWTGSNSFTGKVTFNDSSKDTNFYSNAIFYAQPKIRVNGNARYKSVCTGYTKGTAPTTIQYGGISTTDKNGAEVATFYSTVDTNNTIKSALAVKQPTAKGTVAKEIAIYCDKNDNFHTSCPTPSVGDNSTNIATTAYVNNKFRVVSALPASPDPNTYYFIPE